MPISGGTTTLNIKRQADQTETSSYILLTSGVGVFTKGNWVQMDAVTAELVTALILGFQEGVGGRLYHIDIGVGAAGFEVPIISDLVFDCDNVDQQTAGPYRIEVEIPPGERIAARCSDAAGGNIFRLNLTEEQRT